MREITAFVMQDDYTTLACCRQADGSMSYEALGYMGERYEPAGLYGLADLLRTLFPSAPQIEQVETAGGAISDEAPLVPDLEMFGDSGDPGDRILPEDLVSSGDPIQDEGLTEDVFDLGDGQFPSIDGAVYVAYFVQAERNSANPYGSKDSFAGIIPAFTCRSAGNCDDCHAKYGVSALMGVVEYDTPCKAAWERHPATWEDAQIRTLPAFFQVIAVLPRRLRPGQFKTFRGRDGRLKTVQMKDRPYVVVRWGDLDESGNFIPGVVDYTTGETVERTSVMPAWALYDIQTGKQFSYNEPTGPVRLNQAFRRKVLETAVSRQPELWRTVHHPRALGITQWQVIQQSDGDSYVEAIIGTSGGRTSTVLRPDNLSPLGRFAAQAIAWKEIEFQLSDGLSYDIV